MAKVKQYELRDDILIYLAINPVKIIVEIQRGVSKACGREIYHSAVSRTVSRLKKTGLIIPFKEKRRATRGPEIDQLILTKAGLDLAIQSSLEYPLKIELYEKAYASIYEVSKFRLKIIEAIKQVSGAQTEEFWIKFYRFLISLTSLKLSVKEEVEMVRSFLPVLLGFDKACRVELILGGGDISKYEEDLKSWSEWREAKAKAEKMG